MKEQKRIVITGYGVVSCFGSDPDVFYEKLLQGESGVREITKFDTENLPTRFGAPVQDFDPANFLDKKMARRADPCIGFGVGAGKMALAHAKLDPSKVDKNRVGIVIGSGMGGMDMFTGGVTGFNRGGYRKMSPFFVPFIITNMPGATLAIETGFKGPNYSISTACATANYSIKAAADHIRLGEADVMLTGGVEASINPVCFGGFSACKAMSRNNEDFKGASKPWDKSRDGFVLGEGGAVFVLESLEHALARGAPIIAEYRGGAVTCDAHHMTEPTPDGSDVAKCIELALANGELDPSEIDYINAHATATPVGDLCEIRAVKKVFGPYLDKLRMNGTKSMTGHALGGAGAIELLATLKALETGKLHPTINLKDPEEELEGINAVQGEAQEYPVRAAISNSFGFGGHNCVLAVSKYE